LPPVFLCLLKGALPFYSTLIMNIDCDIITDFMVVSSFRGQITKQTKPQIITDILADIKNRNVIICDDVIDFMENNKRGNYKRGFAILLFFGSFALLGCIMQVGAYGFA
jgi:hypothetical protein